MAQPQRSTTAIQSASLAASRQQYALAENYLLLATLDNSNTGIHQQALTTAAMLVPYTSQIDALDNWFNNNANSRTTLAQQYNFNTAFRRKQHQRAATLGLSLSNNNTLSSAVLQQLWLSLQALSINDVNALLNQQLVGSQGMGWASFAAAYLDNGSSLQQQAQQLASWQAQWPDHTANNIAAKDIEALEQQARTMIQTAAVALPLSGRLSNAGKAIQAAILAAHLERPQFEKIIFVNSANYSSTDALLERIKTYAPQVIIGPIDKTKARELAVNINRTTPLIALNAFDPVTTNLVPAYQLSLNIEDEAEYMANASPEVFSHALLLSTTNTLANRASVAFTNSWETRIDGSLVATKLDTSSDFSKDIERSFLINGSHSRQTALENIFVEKMESNPRRRKDIDVIFLSATANEARAINPLLAYHYAGDLPVLSPSIVFDGRYDSVSNRDLNGIIFSDTPWSIAPTDLKPSMRYHTKNGGAPSKNLHALGIDAYFFAARIGLWKKGLAQSFNGTSGQRLINANGSTKRIPALAKITRQGIIPQTLISE